MEQIRVRVSPSPTGFVHVGTAYMSLFNYAFAKKNKGKFILRIEDTDVKRHVPQAEKTIFDGLRWLDLNYNEGPDVGGSYGPYRQSERLGQYEKYASELAKKGLAYKEKGAIWFKIPAGETSWKDLIRGEIKFENTQIKDFVILRSNGRPVYNFAVVIDDWLMKISHVIRGEEHISNTPRQIMVYQALGAKPPQFAHLPLLRNTDHSKISKRRNNVALSWYQEQGYLPEALVNFLCLLGWSHPQEKDIFSLAEFIKLFSFERVSTSAPIFDLKKLDWLNGVYIRQKTEKELVQLLKPFAPKGMKSALVNQTIPLIKERLVRLSDCSGLVDYFIKEPKVSQTLLVSKSGKDKKLIKQQLESSSKELGKSPWRAKSLEELSRKLAKKNNWQVGNYFMAMRIALTGKAATPPLFETMEALGKDRTIRRLKKTAEKF